MMAPSSPDTEESIFNYSEHFQDDDREDDVDGGGYHSSYFALFRDSNDSSPARQDQEHGRTITRLAYMAFMGHKEGVKVHTPITEATMEVLLPSGAFGHQCQN